jgi:tripartite-type tricarboxylate transporter receptor subunit TctC
MLNKKTTRRHLIKAGGTLTAFASSAAFAPLAAWAQTAATFPSKPIKIVVAYAAGGTTDALARFLGAQLSASLGQPVIVENKAGASGAIGTDQVAKSVPDGHTITLGITALVQLPSMGVKLPFDPQKDLVPLAQVALSNNLFIISSDIAASTLSEFVALAKANPKKYNYGSFGAGTSSHIYGESFKNQAGIDLAHVPYKGSGPLMQDMLGGQLTAAFSDIGSVRPHLASGKFKVLATSGEKRTKATADFPTFTELGFKDFEPFGFFAFFAPAAVPKDILNKLSEEIVRIINVPANTARIEAMGVQVAPLNLADTAQIVKRDQIIWDRIIRAAKITAE